MNRQSAQGTTFGVKRPSEYKPYAPSESLASAPVNVAVSADGSSIAYIPQPPSRPAFQRQGQGGGNNLAIRQTKAGGKFKDKEDSF